MSLFFYIPDSNGSVGLAKVPLLAFCLLGQGPTSGPPVDPLVLLQHWPIAGPLSEITTSGPTLAQQGIYSRP